MIAEFYAVHVEDLALIPVGAGPDGSGGVNLRQRLSRAVVIDRGFDADTFPVEVF